VLKGVSGVAFTQFTAQDVVRHPLVARIVAAYDRASGSEPAHGSPASSSRSPKPTA
jgi:phosphate starvation-inducible PhoH-like protein